MTLTKLIAFVVSGNHTVDYQWVQVANLSLATLDERVITPPPIRVYFTPLYLKLADERCQRREDEEEELGKTA
ncbi:hypothetical protein [Xanthomonas albilineans]|uniref:hypothetical protein n=1 Tax=Xanthomonas albilineans TaxID=29447 RepID=UPI0018B01AFA|nr:hypothetical protein [Xanthomonas albilineans]